MKTSTDLEQAANLLGSISGKNLPLEKKIELSINLAGLILTEANRVQTREERHFQRELGGLVSDAKGKAFITELTDQCFRSQNHERSASQISYIFKKYGVPKSLSIGAKIGLFFLKHFIKLFPNLLVPKMREWIRSESRKVILPGEALELAKHIEKRKAEGVRLNLNRLGEAILGEEEANRRLHTYLSDLADPKIEYISIKISTLYSQINLLADQESLSVLEERLEMLYRQAMRHNFKKRDGTYASKFVNLDMEEYRDLRLTVELFKRVLSKPEFSCLAAGIVLQSYLPDSFEIQKELTQWALDRVKQGGSPIKIRIVKGANLAMEKVEASLRNWKEAPYGSKAESDANFIRMVTYALQAECLQAVHIGVGSHNLFDIAYAMILCAEKEIGASVTFEMLEGMADPVRRTVQKLVKEMLLYCPAAKADQFQNAIAYLVRRLDENTAKQNFLSVSFNLHPGSKAWQEQAEFFAHSCRKMGTASTLPRRTQNRFLSNDRVCKGFDNEPDTDFSLPHNCDWAKDLLKKEALASLSKIPLVIDGEEVFAADRAEIKDPSSPERTLGTYALANLEQMNLVLECASREAPLFAKLSVSERSDLLERIARGLRKNRGALISAMCKSNGKTVFEGDAEVSEAVDFAEYYRRSAEELALLQDIKWKPKGVVLVAPPWNFPVSIPAGGILAGLAAGNVILFKPAPEAVDVGFKLAKIFWEAGVSRKVLQFVPCQDDPVGSAVISDPRVQTVILTGSTETAKLFLKLRPRLDLIAETGGKNSIIVTSMADRDLAVKDIMQSAFGFSGQKCSACSLLILENEVYQDKEFLKQLRDAAASLKVGSPWDFGTKVNPLINSPGKALLRGLTVLDEGEEWLLEPKQDRKNPQLWSPGIKLGVKEGSFTHQTELFGPVLGVMRANNLEHAIQIANATPYGLTSGLQSLDDREKAYWMGKIISGNCYINRGITGAIVERQPFGGTKESSFGKGAKAGGPNYLTQLMTAEQVGEPLGLGIIPKSIKAIYEKQHLSDEQFSLIEKRVQNYVFYYTSYFSKDHDPMQILGQDNLLRYLPHTLITLRLDIKDELADILSIISAAALTKTGLAVSGSKDALSKIKNHAFLKTHKNILLFEETENELVLRLKSQTVNRLRFLTPPSDSLAKKLASLACRLDASPVLANGRLELLHYLREVVFSIDYHRYGNLGIRENEHRSKSCEKKCLNKECCSY